MTYDIDLLRFVQRKENYERFVDVINKHNVSSVTKEIFDVIGSYFSTYPTHTEIDYATLRTFFFLVKGKKVKDVSVYEKVFDNLLSTPPSTATMEMLEQRFIYADYATKVYDEAMGAVLNTPGKSLDNVQVLLDEYTSKSKSIATETDEFVKPTLTSVIDLARSGGLRWRLEEMNISAGPLRKGDFVILAARPEAGKTTFALSEATYFLTQLSKEESVIWINNEEASAKVMLRAISAYHQASIPELLKDTSKYEKEFLAAGGDRFLIVSDDSPYKSAKAIERLFKKYKPGVIVFDQLDKVQGFKNERDDLRIGSLYLWARDVAKTYCPVVAISQLNGSAEGEKWVTMDHLRGSATDKPGEADLIVILGDARDGTLNRYISIAKNKLFGDAHTLEEHRHGSFQVTIDPPHARFISHWK